MTRALTDAEREILAHAVVDPDGWWEHVQSAVNIRDPEEALVDKIARWKPVCEAAKAEHGANYKTRAQHEAMREAAEKASPEAAAK